VEVLDELGYRYEMAQTLNRAGDTFLNAGDSDAARDSWQRGAEVLDELHHPEAEQVRAKLRDLRARP
jgi:hypothetical protein